MANKYAYVCDVSGQAISVIDPTTYLVVTQIVLPGTPFRAYLTDDGLFLYILDTSVSDEVLVVDATANTYLTSISLSSTPANLRLAALGVTDTTCYVVGTTTASLPSTNGVVTIDIATNTVTGNIPLVNCYSPESFVLVTPDQAWVYVAYNDTVGNRLVCISTATDAIVDTYVDLAGEFRGACSNPATTEIYAIDNVTNKMYVTTPGSAHPTSILTLGHPASGFVGTDSTGDWIYVPCTDQTIIVYDAATLTPTVISTAAGSSPIYVVPSSILVPYVYVTDNAGSNLFVLSGNTLVTTATTPAGSPAGAISSDGTVLFLVNSSGDTAPIFSTSTNAQIANPPLTYTQPVWVVTANASPVVVATEQIVMIA